MSALLIAMFLDLAAAQSRPNVELQMSAPKQMMAGKLTPVHVTLRNLGAQTVRVVVESCNSPFSVVIDGKVQTAAGDCNKEFFRTADLGPGASVGDELLVALPRGRHRIEARYQTDTRDAFAGPVRSDSQSVTVSAAVIEVDYY